MRVSQGGHDVPREKLTSRFPRTLKNLGLAIRKLPYVLIFDNNDLSQSFQQIAVFENGMPIFQNKKLPKWISPLIPL